jgi:hypothetical protein
VDSPQLGSLGDIGAGASRFIDIEIPITQAQVDALKASTPAVHIFVYGKAEYTDTFNTKDVHHVRWCGSFPPSFAGVESNNVEICTAHNSSD